MVPPINCRLHRQAKSGAGAAAARNSALKIADPSVFVAFHDSDDVWPTDFLQRTHTLLAVSPRAIAASCDRMFVYANGVPSVLHDSSQLAVNASLWLLEHGAGLASATLFRRETIDRLGHFPLIAAGEDAALFLPLSLEGPWLYASGKPIAFYRGLAERLGDAKNLTDEFSDGRLSWARIYEDFLLCGRGRIYLNNPKYRRLVARMWYMAGRELLQNSAPRPAISCFSKSLAWNPWRGKCYVRMVRACLSALLHPSRPIASSAG
jgi:glycosyltransferase involved in cell wall biosynthesis